MAEPPEFWLFAATNLIVFVLGSVLTTLSYLAYRSRSTSTFLTATLGFGCITAGGAVEPVYQLGIRGYDGLAGRELLAVQGIEGLLVAVGLGMLFYSIRGYPDPPRRSSAAVGVDREDH